MSINKEFDEWCDKCVKMSSDGCYVNDVGICRKAFLAGYNQGQVAGHAQGMIDMDRILKDENTNKIKDD